MSSKEIQEKFTEKYLFVWKQMLLNDNLKTADIVSEMMDLFLSYGTQMFNNGMDSAEQIYSIKKKWL
tara:strand:- start:102 stop:302 length:201 start_codon:yes stop_codon:yes gene_type:complete